MKTSGFPRPRLPDSAARNDVRNQVSVDPVDDAGINISHLKQRRSLWVPGTTIDPNHICHAPGPIRISNDHGHSRFDVKEDLIVFFASFGVALVSLNLYKLSRPAKG